MAEAERLAGSYVMRTLNWSNWRGPSIYLKPGEVLDEETEAALKKELPFDWVQPRSLLFGSPEAVVDQLLEMREALNIECVLVTSDWTGMPHELTMQSLRLFSEKVLPRIAS
jgi:alkanesulfonate monooxygenase SsuD/methylene tetrahydromethanopterin reductase-like flavin-dependent oxidoreductase (luciferase family)